MKEQKFATCGVWIFVTMETMLRAGIMLNSLLNHCDFMQSTQLIWKTRQHFLTVTIYFYHKSFKMLTDIYQPQSLWRRVWVRCTFILLVYHLLSIFHWGKNRSIYDLTLVSHVWRPELTIMTYLHQVGFAFF